MKIVAVLLVVLLVFSCAALAENSDPVPFVPSLPQEAVFLDGGQQDDLYVEHYRCQEEILTLEKKDQMPVRLFSETGTVFREEQDPVLARSVAQEAFPDAFVISEGKPMPAADGFTPFTFYILTDQCAGSLSVAENRIVSRDITFGDYISNDRLTPEGAEKALSFHRPGAAILELELDEDDGLLLYEGEAELNGVLYEFEINAYNGRLLEWERD